MERMGTPAEVAETLKVSTKTLAQWRWQGRGPAWSKIGSTVRYAWTDVEAYRTANRVQPRA
ncbi:helix-turn-helix domain-containing protein [Stackebrandtia soli]|uniref:helix-turn-helix domain-containing protein n=1 Tax=Stackebrandtia soli TaxID=1892856 RepID=UPI0039E9805E